MRNTPSLPRIAIASVCLLAALSALAPAPASADAVILKQGGQRQDGILIEETDDAVILQTATSVIQIPKTAIQEIIRSDAMSEEEKAGDRHLRLNQLDQALERYEKALTTGDSEERVAGKINEVKLAIAEREERAYADQLRMGQEHIAARRYDAAISQLQSILQELEPGLFFDKVQSELARAHLEKAQSLQDTVRYDLAQRELRRAIEVDSTFREAYLQLAELLKDDPQTKDEAKDLFAKAYELNDPDLTTLPEAEKRREGTHIYSWAELLNRDQEHLAAAELYQKVLSAGLTRDFPFVVDRLVQAYLKVGETRQAEDVDKIIDALKRAIEFNAPLQAHYFLAQLYFDEKRYPEAIETLTGMRELDAGYPEAHYLLAQCYKAVGDSDLYYQALLGERRANPRHYSALVELGEYLLEGAKYEEALDLFEEAMNINTGPVRAHLGRAEALRKLGRLSEAYDVCAGLLEIDPNNPNPDVVRQLGLIYFDDRKYAEATEQFLKVVETLEAQRADPAAEPPALLPEVYIRLGDVGIAESQFNKALEFYGKAIKLNPKLAEAHKRTGDCYIALTPKQLESAENAYAQAIQLEPEEPNYYLSMAFLYHRQFESPHEALPFYLRYLELGGKDVENVSRYVSECGGTPDQKAELDIARLRARINQRRLTANLAVNNSIPAAVAQPPADADSPTTATAASVAVETPPMETAPAPPESEEAP